MLEDDLLKLEYRIKIINDIKSDENKRRKAEHLRRFEIYQERQGPYIIERLTNEFDQATVNDMRKILSINLAPRIINSQASLYTGDVEREFLDVSPIQLEQLQNLYKKAKANRKYKKSNRYFKLSDQTTMQVIPSDGVIELRPILQHLYDVIPRDDNNEKAMAYVLSTFDKSEYVQDLQGSSNDDTKLGTASPSGTFNQQIDGVNQSIADADDYKSGLEKYIVWSDKYHFTMNGSGLITSEDFKNPIGKLPFIDVADDKDQEFFCRKGNNTIDFVLDFGLLLSDVANTNRLQSYAQAVISSEKMPEEMRLGPNRVLHLKINPSRPEINPTFAFVAPNVDLSGSLDLLETYLKLFLSAKGLDPKMISGKSDGVKFASGLDRLLSMIEQFEATKDDMDLFSDVEQEGFELLVKWSNRFQSVDPLQGGLKPDLRLATIPPNAKLEVIYPEPSMLKSQKEIEESVAFQLSENLMSRVEAVSKIRGVSIEKAEEIVEALDKLIMDAVQKPKVKDEVLPPIDDNELIGDVNDLDEEPKEEL